MSKKIGVFLSRMQPLHKGHMGMIDKALSENDKVIILIGSTNKEGTIRNPLGIELRREILQEALEESYTKEDLERIYIKNLPDWSMETDYDSFLEWGRYLYYNITAIAEQKNFSMYFSDDREIIENWFEDEEIRKRIELKIFERASMFEAVSSTKIRNAFLNGDREYIKNSVPKAVERRFDLIKGIIDKVYESPKEDYNME